MKTTDIERVVLEKCRKEGWETNPYKDLARITQELGELSTEIIRYEDGRERPDEVEVDKEAIKRDMASEIGDILFPLVKIASHYGITLEEAFATHTDKMNKRYDNQEE